MSQDQAYNRMIASLTRSVMLLMSIAVIVFVFTSASEVISNTANDEIATVQFPKDGAILGSIISEDESFEMTLTNDTDTFKREINAMEDYFFNGINPGNYSITIQSSTNEELIVYIGDVEIIKGEVTALGVHEL
jgi:hypothetical protein